MATGWKSVGGTWYYLNSGGDMATGWKNVGGAWYYLNDDGSMAANEWAGNYWLGASGAMATDGWVDGGKYYVGPDGAWIPNYGQTLSDDTTVHWARSGNIVHTDFGCPALKNATEGTVSTGTYAQAKAAGHSELCKVCAGK